MLVLRLFLCILLTGGANARDYQFDGTMPEATLRSYLSRSMTLMYLLTGQGNLEDNIRMMKSTGVKFAGRAVHNWGREQGGESSLPILTFPGGGELIVEVHRARTQRHCR